MPGALREFEKTHGELRLPTQAKERLEWGTQQFFLPPEFFGASLRENRKRNRRHLTQSTFSFAGQKGFDLSGGG